MSENRDTEDMDLVELVQALAAEVKNLRGEIEDLNYRIDNLENARLTERVDDLERFSM